MPTTISPEHEKLIKETAVDFAERIARHYTAGFGIFPSADPASNYFNQVWARDAAHAGGNYFSRANPQAAIDSLATLLLHQRPDGSLPSRVEREHQFVKFMPVVRRWSPNIFRAIEVGFRKRTERPVHEGQDFAGGEDTVPVTLIAAGELFNGSERGRKFVLENFNKLMHAAEFFYETKVDREDGLAVMKRENPDWADTILRRGKLSTINIWWARGLRYLEHIAEESGEDEKAAWCGEEYKKVHESIIKKLLNNDRAIVVNDMDNPAVNGIGGTYFRATATDDRLDTVASIFGALYFLDADSALAVERTLKARVERGSGLANFDPPYTQKDVHWVPRLMGQWLYHNKFVWPWVTCQNISVKIKIARDHAKAAIRDEFQREAVEDLAKMAQRFRDAGGAYEILQPDESKFGSTRFYTPPQYFMGSMASWLGAYAQLKELGWIKE
jgi:hypothetical protein